MSGDVIPTCPAPPGRALRACVLKCLVCNTYCYNPFRGHCCVCFLKYTVFHSYISVCIFPLCDCTLWPACHVPRLSYVSPKRLSTHLLAKVQTVGGAENSQWCRERGEREAKGGLYRTGQSHVWNIEHTQTEMQVWEAVYILKSTCSSEHLMV